GRISFLVQLLELLSLPTEGPELASSFELPFGLRIWSPAAPAARKLIRLEAFRKFRDDALLQSLLELHERLDDEIVKVLVELDVVDGHYRAVLVEVRDVPVVCAPRLQVERELRRVVLVGQVAFPFFVPAVLAVVLGTLDF